MPLTPRSLRLADPASLDRELEALHQVVAAARRNRWHGGSDIEPEFENFLAALTSTPSPSIGSQLEPGPAWRHRRNSWQERLHEVG